MTKKRNCSIDIFRYLAAILVVALHTTPFMEFSPIISYFFSQVLPRIAVPFFFTVSGFYYSSKLENGCGSLKSVIGKLLIPYTLWSFVYFSLDYITYGSVNFFAAIKKFLFYGSAYQLWFIPSLIFSCIVTTCLYRFGRGKFLLILSGLMYLFGCLGNAYGRIGDHITFISAIIHDPQWPWISNFVIMGLAFFNCGVLLKKTEPRWIEWNSTKQKLILILCAGLYLTEIIVIKILDIAESITITLSMYGLVFVLVGFLMKHPFSQQKKLAECCRVLSNYIYYSHVMFLILIDHIISEYLGLSISATFQFFLIIFLTHLGGILIYRSKKKWLRVWAS